MKRLLDVLLIEDREDDAILISRCLSRAGYEPNVLRVETEQEMRDAIAARKWDVVLSDYALPRFDCRQALHVLVETGLDIPFIALSGTVNEEAILELVRSGARDYVMKDNLARLPSAIDRELREAEGRKERRRLEAQLVQAMKMEAIGRLAGGVAHDFNNLLTVITGFAELALLEDNPARAGLEQILQAAERAAGLTRQLLAFSRQQAMEPRIFDLNDLVHDMEKMLRRLIGEDIQVGVRLADAPMMVKADPGQIEQVVLNLAVNSRDAMPLGGRLIISTASRRLEGSHAKAHGIPDGQYCAISISDNGIGIPPDVLPHIFEPFYTTKPAGKGTGLGLSTVYGIVQQSGGAIQPYTEKDLGTTMTVFLPAAGAAEEDLPSSRELGRMTGSETVLIAEDDPNVLNLISESLAAHGFDVMRAENGEAALEKIQRGDLAIDILITDVVMPGISGRALALRAAESIPDLKVLFMSGYTEEVIQHHGISSSNVAFLQKPFAPGDLVRKVRHLLDGERARTLAAK
jgi:two-component system, cell cycle sensor histidine kinase and response regulator CckA